VGTGWDGLHPILLSVLGAERVVTFDHVAHLRFEHAALVVAELAENPALDELERLAPGARERLLQLTQAVDLPDLLQRARIDYRAPADMTRSGLPAASVDVVYDFAVLEHVSEKVIDGIVRESKRLLKPGGVMVSVIGTGDHYVSVDRSLTRVNFLKYPEWVWAPLVKNKISYHNRLREKQILQRFTEQGAHVRWLKSHIEARDVAAASSMNINLRFAGMTPEELAVSRVDVIVDFA
jgi:SAM-dependent methyltransferase